MKSQMTEMNMNVNKRSRSWRGRRLRGVPGDPTDGCSNQGKGGGSGLIICRNYSLLKPDLEDLFLIWVYYVIHVGPAGEILDVQKLLS